MSRKPTLCSQPSKAREANSDPLGDALLRCQRLGTSDFFVSPAHMLLILRRVMPDLPRPVLSINRPQVGGQKLVHRLEWRNLVFTCVTHRPLTVT